MQSRPTDVSQESLPSSISSDQTQAAQHGLEDLHDSLLPVNHGEERANSGRRSPTSSEGSGWSRSPSTSTSASGGQRRLRKESWNDASYPKDRIAEYERHSSVKTKRNRKHHGPEFRVISGGDHAGNHSSLFATFPNGLQSFTYVD